MRRPAKIAHLRHRDRTPGLKHFCLELLGQYDIGVVERERGAQIARHVRPADVA
jgi:hypothetical protein